MNNELQAEYIKKMQACVDESKDRTGKEGAHTKADALLCELLEKLGYKDLVDKYDEVNKWYS